MRRNRLHPDGAYRRERRPAGSVQITVTFLVLSVFLAWAADCGRLWQMERREEVSMYRGGVAAPGEKSLCCLRSKPS